MLKPCLKVLDEMFFYSDGTAPSCCWDDAGRGIVGDVKKESVLDIWNGAVLRSMRALLDRGRRDDVHAADARGGARLDDDQRRIGRRTED